VGAVVIVERALDIKAEDLGKHLTPPFLIWKMERIVSPACLVNSHLRGSDGVKALSRAQRATRVGRSAAYFIYFIVLFYFVCTEN
jgi:hypothetical protein